MVSSQCDPDHYGCHEDSADHVDPMAERERMLPSEEDLLTSGVATPRRAG
jgi:hypothetical protein